MYPCTLRFTNEDAMQPSLYSIIYTYMAMAQCERKRSSLRAHISKHILWSNVRSFYFTSSQVHECECVCVCALRNIYNMCCASNKKDVCVVVMVILCCAHCCTFSWLKKSATTRSFALRTLANKLRE